MMTTRRQNLMATFVIVGIGASIVLVIPTLMRSSAGLWIIVALFAMMMVLTGRGVVLSSIAGILGAIAATSVMSRLAFLLFDDDMAFQQYFAKRQFEYLNSYLFPLTFALSFLIITAAGLAIREYIIQRRLPGRARQPWDDEMISFWPTLCAMLVAVLAIGIFNWKTFAIGYHVMEFQSQRPSTYTIKQHLGSHWNDPKAQYQIHRDRLTELGYYKTVEREFDSYLSAETTRKFFGNLIFQNSSRPMADVELDVWEPSQQMRIRIWTLPGYDTFWENRFDEFEVARPGSSSPVP